MKNLALCLFLMGAVVAAPIFAQTVIAQDDFSKLGDWKPAYGTWNANGALVQSDIKAGMARIDRPLPQSGVYLLEFTAKYIDGGYADPKAYVSGPYHGGFGIHIGVDKPAPGKAWGNGKSYLLWINYDDTVPPNSPHYGLRAQVYQSTSNIKMELMPNSSIEIYPRDVVLQNLNYLQYALPVKLRVDTNTGEIRVYDPMEEGYYYYFYLDPKLLKGAYVSFRTNKLAMQFDDFKVTKLE
ncbi:MAG: hypothetical protein N2442_02035 [Spirochaetes bacterium]|nr:hypothetical protein [Spirochaetota bacterium]